jgi:hypothetical protein
MQGDDAIVPAVVTVHAAQAMRHYPTVERGAVVVLRN